MGICDNNFNCDINGLTTQEQICNLGQKVNEVIDAFNRMPDGPQGPQGIQGPEGPIGPRGERGPIGPKGNDGDVAFKDLTPAQKQELKGEKGDIGPVGPEGPQGERGVKGDRGDVGPIGPQGAIGPQGEKGELGHFVFRRQKVKRNYADWINAASGSTQWLVGNFEETNHHELLQGDSIVITGGVTEFPDMVMTIIGRIGQGYHEGATTIDVIGRAVASHMDTLEPIWLTRQEAEQNFLTVDHQDVIDDADLVHEHPNSLTYTNEVTEHLPQELTGDYKKGVLLTLHDRTISVEAGYQYYFCFGGTTKDQNDNLQGRTWARSYRMNWADPNSTNWTPWKKMANTDDFYAKNKTYSKEEVDHIKDLLAHDIDANTAAIDFEREERHGMDQFFTDTLQGMEETIGQNNKDIERNHVAITKLQDSVKAQEVTFMKYSDMEKIKTTLLDGSDPNTYISLQPAKTGVIVRGKAVDNPDLPPDWNQGDGILTNHFTDYDLGTGYQEWVCSGNGNVWRRTVQNMKNPAARAATFGKWEMSVSDTDLKTETDKINTKFNDYSTTTQMNNRLEAMMEQMVTLDKVQTSTKLNGYVTNIDDWKTNGEAKVGAETTGGVIPNEVGSDDKWGTVSFTEENPNGTGIQTYKTLTNKTFTRTKVGSGNWSEWLKLLTKQDAYLKTDWFFELDSQRYPLNSANSNRGYVQPGEKEPYSKWDDGGYLNLPCGLTIQWRRRRCGTGVPGAKVIEFDKLEHVSTYIFSQFTPNDGGEWIQQMQITPAKDGPRPGATLVCNAKDWMHFNVFAIGPTRR